MIRAEYYMATDPYLTRLRDTTVIRSDQCNRELDTAKRMTLYREWMGVSESTWIMRNFTCEYVCPVLPLLLANDMFMG